MQDLEAKKSFLQQMRGYGRKGLQDSLSEDAAAPGLAPGEEVAAIEVDVDPESGSLDEDIAAIGGAKRSLGFGSVEDVTDWNAPTPRELGLLDAPEDAEPTAEALPEDEEGILEYLKSLLPDFGD